jgi:elongation factor P hydroxylase
MFGLIAIFNTTFMHTNKAKLSNDDDETLIVDSIPTIIIIIFAV